LKHTNENIKNCITLLDDKDIKHNLRTVELNDCSKKLLSINNNKKYENEQKADFTIDFKNHENINTSKTLQNKGKLIYNIYFLKIISDRINIKNNLATNENEAGLSVEKINSVSNLSNKNQKNLSLEKENYDSFNNKVQINDYDLLKTNNNIVNSCVNIGDSNRHKGFENSSTKENLYNNKSENTGNNKKIQEQLVYKKLLEGNDDEKYAVYSDNYICNEDSGSFNFINIQENYFNEKSLQEIKREKIIEEVKDKLFDLLFKSKLK